MTTINKNVDCEAKPHTIKKFELIEAYTEAWAVKLLEYGIRTGQCDKLVFIDCMSMSGIYHDGSGNRVEGTPIRVARVFAKIMADPRYRNKRASLYFNDKLPERIEELRKHLPPDTANLHIHTSIGDGNELIKLISSKFSSGQKLNYLLVYDPYNASVDWTAIFPFLRYWGEVIINHMVSDPVRAVSQAKKPDTISKYEHTYLTKLDELLSFGGDRSAYEKRFEDIIRTLATYENIPSRRYYIASYPFFNTRNALVYNLIHCTGNIKGFKLYKSTAWKTFGNRSSTKASHSDPNQLSIKFDEDSDTKETDQECYDVHDIVLYIEKKFAKKTAVPLDVIWKALDEHPVFPSDLFKNEIKKLLKSDGCRIHRSYIDFDVMQDDK